MPVGARALLVEDSATEAMRTRVVLESGGFTVDVVTSGEASLQVFRRGKYDLVIADVVMPGIDGFEVCRQIKSIANVPVVLIATPVDPLVIMSALESGADSFVTKPLDDDGLAVRPPSQSPA